MLADWGFPRISARVLLTMMSADEDSLTAGELGDRLGVSPSAISGAVRYLMQVGLLERRPVPRLTPQ
ncbi:MarR family transcriptional regulator [Nonomuraea diastatica]|uniref:MarR family transcriptional regulator n=2 Tax=Nonomuraea diastatica TaxID=1848329 RepID=A0A4R4WE30_9ACTN|nr:MarR family transcriptional regulator [Nonomuraea diastatica]